MPRRAFPLAFAVLPLALSAGCAKEGSPADAWLLVDRAQIEAAKGKAARQPWAKEILDGLLARAAAALATPPSIPERGGQWLHHYACRKDGQPLEPDVASKGHRCKACGEIHRGDPYDAAYHTKLHLANAEAVRDLGLAFRFTGERAYAERAAAILSAYAERYRRYPLHDLRGESRDRGGRIGPDALTESLWLIPATWGYALVKERIPVEERRRIETDLLLPACETIRLNQRLKIHNMQCWKNSAIGLVGFATQREDLVREAIEDPESGWRAQVAQGVTEEGLWWEGSLGYHRYAMDALWPLAEAARLAGTDLYTERYRRMFLAPLSLYLSDGLPPGFNDAPGSAIGSFARHAEIAYARTRDPAIGAFLAAHPRKSLESLLWGVETLPAEARSLKPETRSSVWLADAGYAVLRAGKTEVAVRFGRHGGAHGHFDKPGIVTAHAGVRFALDPGTVAYGHTLHASWYRTTAAHNSVSVDGATQSRAEGVVESWSATPDRTELVVRVDGLYPNVVLRRRLTLEPGRLLDRLEAESGAEHVYDWILHCRGDLACSVPLALREAPLGDADGYPHLKGLREGKADGDVEASWTRDGARLTLRVKGEAGTEVFTGTAPGERADEEVPFLLIRRRARRTAFEVEHLLVGSGHGE